MTDSSLNLSRRTFVKTTGALGALAAAIDSVFGSNAAVTYADAEEKTTWGHCAINCPGRCALRFHVKDDEVVWVDAFTSKDAGFDEVQPRACLRGRTYRRWLANPERVSYPMKRVASVAKASSSASAGTRPLRLSQASFPASSTSTVTKRSLFPMQRG